MSHDPQNIPNRHGDSTERCAPALIVNADDWGRDVDTTDRSLDCVLKQTVSSVSAMLFMADSERAAFLAAQHGVDAGLHLNFTLPFSAPQCPSGVLQHQQKLARFLTATSYAQVLYHPGLAASFDYVVKAQLEEYQRLYNAPPTRIDGHHHMHLCANVLFSKLVPAGTLVRRNFSFVRGEKSWINRFYRSWIDARLQRRHRLVDFLFSLAPIEPVDRLRRIADLARHAVVELETHPIHPEEYRFLTSGEIFQQLNDLRIARGFAACASEQAVSSQIVY
jgi:hypothetical protein